MSNNLDLASLEAWRSDPRMKEALNLIGQLVEERGAELAEVVPADPQRAEKTKASLEAFAELRGGGLYYPYLSTGVGNGPWVQLADGSVKLDFITGIGVHGLGHSHPDLREAGVVAAALDTVMQGNLQQFEFSIDACRGFVELARLQGGNIQHLTLSTSGAMANENALKLAFHKRPGAHRILAFEHCFAGRTLALSQLTDKAAYRVGLPPTIVQLCMSFKVTRRKVDALQFSLL